MHKMHRNVISVENIIWKRDGQTILDHISWQVNKSEHWAILGLNGSGKTSLLNIIAGYEWPSSGKVQVLGHRYGQTNLPLLRQSMGWVSSAFEEKWQTRLGQSVHHMVMSGKFASIGIHGEVTAEDENKAYELCDKFHIAHIVDAPISYLSEGEKKKVMLARAWMAEPQLLILDEPCSGLDLRAREDLLQTVQTAASTENGPTILYVTHHVEEVMPAFTHALLMHQGRIHAAGKKQETMTGMGLSDIFEVPVQLSWQDDRPWIAIHTKA